MLPQTHYHTLYSNCQSKGTSNTLAYIVFQLPGQRDPNTLAYIVFQLSGQRDPNTLSYIVFQLSGQRDPNTLSYIVFQLSGQSDPNTLSYIVLQLSGQRDPKHIIIHCIPTVRTKGPQTHYHTLHYNCQDKWAPNTLAYIVFQLSEQRHLKHIRIVISRWREWVGIITQTPQSLRKCANHLTKILDR